MVTGSYMSKTLHGRFIRINGHFGYSVRIKYVMHCITAFLIMGFAGICRAQTFTTEHDTVCALLNSGGAVYDDLTNLTTADIPVKWKVVACDFPQDWQD